MQIVNQISECWQSVIVNSPLASSVFLLFHELVSDFTDSSFRSVLLLLLIGAVTLAHTTTDHDHYTRRQRANGVMEPNLMILLDEFRRRFYEHEAKLERRFSLLEAHFASNPQ